MTSPTIVATVTHTSLTASVASATIYTPAVAGLYQIVGYMDCSSSGGANAYCVPRISWDDGVGANGPLQLGAMTGVAPNYLGFTYQFWSSASAIALEIDVNNGGTFDVHAVLLQMT